MLKFTLCCLLFLTTILSYSQSSKLTKQETIDAIKEYYEYFKTGSYSYLEANGKAIVGSDNYTKFTDNYCVEITNCNFKITFDVYNTTSNEIENSTTIRLNLNDVKSLKKGKKKQLKLKQGFIEILNRTIIFQMMKNKKINVCQKFKDKTIQKELSHFEIKIVPHYEAYPNQKQPDFIDDLMVNYFNNIIALCKNESIGITTN